MLLFRMASEKGVNMKNKVIFGCVGVLCLGNGLLSRKLFGKHILLWTGGN